MRILIGLLMLSAAQGAVPLVAGGQPQAAVVLPAEPTAVVRYAADELVSHLRLATGVALPVAAENALPAAPAGRIYLGPCRAAAAAGLNPAGLKSDGFYLQARGGDLFIIGRDGPEDPLQTTTLAGTLMGVYELLETQLGVRWLWPGELGTEVPRRTELALPDLNLRYEPPLLQRQVRSGLNLRGDLSRGFTAQGASDYARAQTVFLRRHRMAQTVPLKYGHAYESWWEQHGQQHPEWFQLLANGKRGPASPRSRFSMCVSNPEFHEQVVQTWRELRQTRPGINLNGCENDIAGLCTCESCLAWDGPQPTDIHPRFGPRVVSDRYAQFWLTVQQMAAKEDPNAFVLGYAYVNYAPPPSEKIKLNDNVWVGTVPDLFFPRSEEEQAWVKTQWEGWRRTGCRLFLRPNYTLDGYCMPQIYATQFADEFRFEAERGMIATDFDSLTGQWSTQGPNLYLLMRLHTRFERTADDLLAEYYAGFGPAGPKVREYFEQWERYSNDVVRKGKASGMGIYSTYASQAHLLFPESALAASDKILAEAAALAREPVHTARVAWLRKGLEHAILASRTARLMAGGDDRYRPSAAREAVAELTAFRQATEGQHLANYGFCSYVEGRSWMPSPGYDGEPLVALGSGQGALGAEAAFALRNRTTAVAVLGAGEAFGARVSTRKIGDRTEAVAWTVYGPDGAKVASGEIPAGKEAAISTAVPRPGTYVLLVNAGFNAARLTLLNAHAALAARRLNLIGSGGPLYFAVPAGTRQFKLSLGSDAPGETAAFVLRDGAGKEVYHGATTEVRELTPTIEVAPDQAGQVWCLTYGAAPTGVLEDVRIGIEGLPAYFSHDPSRLVQPAPAQ